MVSSHNILVNKIKKELEAQGEKIRSPRAWIRGPAEIDVISYSEPPMMTHPLLKVIEVKDSVYDLQRAYYQILVARYLLHKDTRGLFYIAISKKLYDELERLQHLDTFLKIVSGPIVCITSTIVNGQVSTRTQETISRLGIGVVVVNEKEEKVWKKRTVLAEAELMDV